MRFPGFEGEWEVKRLSYFIKSLNSGVSVNSLDRVATQNEFGILKTSSVSNGLFKPDENKAILPEEIPRAKLNPIQNSIIISRMNTPDLVGEIGYVDRNYSRLFIPDRLWMTETNDNINVKWLSYSLVTPRLKSSISSIGTGTSGSMKNISKPNFLGLVIKYPEKLEQQKIATFLTLIDQRIQTQMKIIAQLETSMRYLRDKLFKQEIRFKNEDGGDYPEWEQVHLGDIGETFNGLTGKTKEDFGKGKPYIQYKQIFDHSKIDISKCDFVQIKQNENQKLVKRGDVFFTTSSETPYEIGMSSVLLTDVEEMYLNSFCFGYRPSSLKTLLPEFARFLFRSVSLRKKITALAQGSTRFNMSKIELMKLTIHLPKFEEQTRIANFLSAFDKKLESEKQLLAQYELQKKYLLQNLFV